MNNVVLVGRLVKDPELRTTQNGTAVCNFTIAVDRRFKDANGEKQTDFLSMTAWGKTGEFVNQYFNKGKKIGIIGELRSRSWDAEDGTKRYATDVNVDQAHFVESKNAESAAPSADNGFLPPAPASDDNGGFSPAADDSQLPFDL